MREFEFRAWLGDKRNKMKYFDFSDWENIDWLRYEKVMQSTGLTDKNKKQIYEKDIIKDPHGVVGCQWKMGFQIW